jgi:hypothetical protein
MTAIIQALPWASAEVYSKAYTMDRCAKQSRWRAEYSKVNRGISRSWLDCSSTAALLRGCSEKIQISQKDARWFRIWRRLLSPGKSQPSSSAVPSLAPHPQLGCGGIHDHNKCRSQNERARGPGNNQFELTDARDAAQRIDSAARVVRMAVPTEVRLCATNPLGRAL